jgi:hypothetical protein
MADFELVGPERKGISSRWRTVRIGERSYQVGVERGNVPIRIPYRRRGGNIGWHWWGTVRDEKGKQVWHGQVSKNAGVRGLLVAAELIPAPRQKGRSRASSG